jgi:hypothetical protein
MHVDNLIQRADLNQRITRALQIKGQKSPVLTLDNTVSAVVIAEDLTKQKEWLAPTERKLAAHALIAAVAAEFGIMAVSNPVGSGVIGLVERVTSYAPTSAQFLFGLVDPLAVPVAPSDLFFRDRRNVGAPTLRNFDGTDGAIRVVNDYLTWQTSNSISTPWYETEGIVIQPGETFGIQCRTANLAVTLTMWLQEIPIA